MHPMTEKLQKTETEAKSMWGYEVINRNEIQVKFMYSYLSSEKDIYPI